MTLRLSRIDGSNIADHTRLRAEDVCLYLHEYTSGRDFNFGATNDLISNLKKKPSSGPGVLKWKAKAIQICAERFRETLNPVWLNNATIVPVPSSKAADHAEFDLRMQQVAQLIRPGLDIRSIVRQTASLGYSHEGHRHSVEDLLNVYEIDEKLTTPEPTAIGILDDVLTAGTHFRAMDTVLRKRFPNASIVGLFVARRVFPDDAV